MYLIKKNNKIEKFNAVLFFGTAARKMTETIENKTYTMNLQSKYWKEMADELKKMELRLRDPKRQKIIVGDIIIFIENGTGNELKTKVIGLKTFESFKNALESTSSVEDFLPGVSSVNEGVHVYHSIPGYKDKEKTYGVLRINIQIIE